MCRRCAMPPAEALKLVGIESRRDHFPSQVSGGEQQRVNVIVSLDAPPESLGVGYRLEARFFTASKENALIVPRTAVLQAPDGSLYVFRIANGELQKAPVELGLRSDLEIEVVSGLAESDRIVWSPDGAMAEGETVPAR